MSAPWCSSPQPLKGGPMQLGQPRHALSQLSPSWSSQIQQHPDLLSKLLWCVLVGV